MPGAGGPPYGGPPPPPGLPSPGGPPVATSARGRAGSAPGFNGCEQYPADHLLPFETIVGGGTVRTYDLTPADKRVQYVIKTNGRPLKGMVQMWVGPIRNTHTLEMNCQDGSVTPVRGTLKVKPGYQTLKISTSDEHQMPFIAAVSIPSPQKNDELEDNFMKIWNESPKQKVQGGSTVGGFGAVTTFPVADNVEAVQLMIWSKNTGRKSCKAIIEVLQGPNNYKQEFHLQVSGSNQPYHAVFETPGPGWIVRMQNKKYVEDGLFEAVVVPYKVGDGGSLPYTPMKVW